MSKTDNQASIPLLRLFPVLQGSTTETTAPLNAIRTDGSFNSEELLRLLNKMRDAPPRVSDGKRFWALRERKRIAALPAMAPLGTPLWQTKLGAELQNLQLLIDEWLATGDAIHGGHYPAARDLTKAPKATAAVKSFFQKTTPKLIPDKDGVCLDFGRGPQFALDNTADATVAFSGLMMTEWKKKLAKCWKPECGRYFELSHWNREYPRGTLCPQCQRAASQNSALVGTKEKREEAAEQLYRLAAEWLIQKGLGKSEWHLDHKTKGRIADYLTKQIKRQRELRAVYDVGNRNCEVTDRWVSRTKNILGINDAIRSRK